MLTPDRLNTFVFGGFAAVALTIAVVDVAGVLAFSVSGRIREFGIRLALGSQPRDLLRGVITEGAIIAAVGVLAGAILGGALTRVAGTYLFDQEAKCTASDSVCFGAARLGGSGIAAASGTRRES